MNLTRGSIWPTFGSKLRGNCPKARAIWSSDLETARESEPFACPTSCLSGDDRSTKRMVDKAATSAMATFAASLCRADAGARVSMLVRIASSS